MKYPVGSNLIIEGSISGTDEYSKAIELRGDNRASFECGVVSITDSGNATVTLTLQGSNDLANWTDLASASSSTVPDRIIKSNSSPVQWSAVRLKYNVVSTATSKVTLQPLIETAKVG